MEVKVWISVTLFCLVSVCSCLPYERLSAKLDIIELALHAERKEDTTFILDKLNKIEEKFNAVIGSGSFPRNPEKADKKSESIDSTDERKTLFASHERLLKAFREEKSSNARMKRHVALLLERVTGLENQNVGIGILQQKTFELLQKHDEKSDAEHRLNVKHRTEMNKCSNEISETLNDILPFNDTLHNIHEVLSAVESNTQTAIKVIQKVDDQTSKPNDCNNINTRISGVYNIYPQFRPSGVEVYCDMETDGGGWTVFQRRVDGSEDFFRGWDDYKNGFGDLNNEFWLGNNYLHEFTTTNTRELRIELEDMEGNRAYAKYTLFSIGTEDDEFTLHVGGLSGDAGDSLEYHNNRPFSTKDRDNDDSPGNCADDYKAAWWYRYCHRSNLNGLFHTDTRDGRSYRWIIWFNWHNSMDALLRAEMKFR